MADNEITVEAPDHTSVGEIVHRVDEHGNCSPYVITAVLADEYSGDDLTEDNESLWAIMGARVQGPSGVEIRMEHSGEGHRYTWHYRQEC